MPWVEPIARRAAWITIATAVIAFLALGRQFVIPLALAVLIAFMLSPIVRWLNHRMGSRIAAVSIATILGLILVAGIGYVAVRQMFNFASDLPQYRHNIAKRLIEWRGDGTGVVSRAIATLGDIQDEVQGKPLLTPIPVKQTEDSSWKRMFEEQIVPIIEPLATAAIVVVLIVLLLLYGEDLRDRVVVLAGTQQISVTSQALEEASHKIGRYLLMLGVVNTMFGTCIGLGLMFIGIPNALLLGLVAGILRFIPLLGAWLGAVVPVLLALAISPNWNGVFLVFGLFLLMEVLTNFIIEPWLYGHSTGISGTAVIIAILFWTWIWGPLGLLLAVPITVCLVVFGKYLEPLRVFHILFSDEPMLAGERRLYHRLVTGDMVSAETILRESMEADGRVQTADLLVIPALQAARQDHDRGTLSEDRLAIVNETLASILGDIEVDKPTVNEMNRVLCVPVEKSDHPTAQIVTATIGHESHRAAVLLESSLLTDVVEQTQQLEAATVVLIAVSSESMVRARLLAKALARRIADVRIIIGDMRGEGTGVVSESTASGVVVSSTVADIVDRVQQIQRGQVGVTEPVTPTAPMVPVPPTSVPAT
jgi:predicted PurR-regulated permease PerM